jgi:hypothetical protein
MDAGPRRFRERFILDYAAKPRRFLSRAGISIVLLAGLLGGRFIWERRTRPAVTVMPPTTRVGKYIEVWREEPTTQPFFNPVITLPDTLPSHNRPLKLAPDDRILLPRERDQ